MPDYDFSTPGLTSTHSSGGAVVLNRPEEEYHKVITNRSGRFEGFPGVERGDWVCDCSDRCRMDEGEVSMFYSAEFEERGEGWRCYWRVQPDGRFWDTEDCMGLYVDKEIVLYAALDCDGCFTGPFRIYSIGGELVEGAG